MRAFLSTLTCLSAVGLAPSAWAVKLERHPFDERDLATLQDVSSDAKAKLLEAEKQLVAGQPAAAAEALRQASALAPKSALVARRHCQALALLGQRGAALAACNRAVKNEGSPMDHRALVAALMAGSAPPNTDDLAQAIEISLSLQKKIPDQALGYAALGDVARRLRDPVMLQTALDELEARAPTHPETQRLRAVVQKPSTLIYSLAWFSVAAVGIVTVLHAMLRRWRARRLLSNVAPAALVALIALGARPVHAQDSAPSAAPAPPGGIVEDKKDDKWQLSEFKIDHDNPEKSVPSIEARNAKPLQFGYYLQDLGAMAAKADQADDPAKAVKYWRALAVAVPDRAIGFSKACANYEALRERAKGLPICARALELEGSTVEDHLRFARMALSGSAPLPPNELAMLDASIAHLRLDAASATAGDQVQCQVGIKLADLKRLDECIGNLSKTKPGAPEVLTFQWSRAMVAKDFGEARRLVAQLSKAGLKPDALAKMKRATDEEGAWWRRPLRDWRWATALGVVLLGAALGVAVTILRLRRRASGTPAPA
jgi:tetratricopeptide (TPR) repeat protein